MTAHVRFVGDVVRKTGEQTLLRAEYEKSRRARELGEQSGLFVVPRVVDFDPEAGHVDFEKIDGLRTLEQLLLEENIRIPDLLRRSGRALAAVHAGLRLPDVMKKDLPGDWMSDDLVCGFLHGDFTPANLCQQVTTNELVILDWSAAPILKGAVTFGPLWFDILWFLQHMFQIMPLRVKPGVAAHELADAIVDGYLSQGQTGVTAGSFKRARNAITPILREFVMDRMARRPWYKKGPFLVRQLLHYQRWWRFKPETPA